MIILQTNLIMKHFHRTFIISQGTTSSQVKNFCYTRIILQSLKNPQLSEPSSPREKFTQVLKKIVYNSKIKHGRMMEEKVEKKLLDDAKLTKYQIEGPQVVALKYFCNEFVDEINSSAERVKEKVETERVNFPYERHYSVSIDAVTDDQKKEDIGLCESISKSQENELPFQDVKDRVCRRPKKWMKDYNKYVEISVKQNEQEEESEEDDDNRPDVTYYGSADPHIPSSSVPCGGCGAHLHCQDSAIPGYLPKELFVGLKEDQLQAVVCQRCHFLREYNTALSVTVDPQTYPRLLSKIKDKPALVILVVDMTDFPCSIWPGILDIIGPKRPLVVVGNKIDLVQDWSKKWLDRAKEALVAQLPPRANLLHVSLVSAKTGYGIEQLVTSIYNLWQYRGDVYLVGCTNVGKSTLFNALLQSDYCKTKAVDLVQRATTAPWPGTTLNLLKFPIMRPDGWRLAMRSHRLKTQQEEDLKLIQEGKAEATPQMITRINRTFATGKTDKYCDDYWEDPFAMPRLSTLRRLKPTGSGLDPADPVFVNSKWLFDTPGVITPDQIIDLLTAEELLLTLPRRPLVPRTLQVWPGQSLMVGGLGRIDYVSGSTNIKMTVLAAHTLPVTICLLSDADEIYDHCLGSAALAVPCGSALRLKKWPGLTAAPAFVLRGTGWKESCADVVLSSAGWVAITVEQDAMCQLQAWTPGARGIHVRFPPVLPRAIAVKGCKMHKSPAYALFNKLIKEKR